MALALTVRVPSGFQFAVTEQNDIYIGSNGNFAGAFGIEAVANVCRHCAQAILGEMVLATSQGMPYFPAIWNGTPSTKAFEAAFRSRITSVRHVIAITSLDIVLVGEVMQYSATIQTDYGEVSING